MRRPPPSYVSSGLHCSPINQRATVINVPTAAAHVPDLAPYRLGHSPAPSPPVPPIPYPYFLITVWYGTVLVYCSCSTSKTIKPHPFRRKGGLIGLRGKKPCFASSQLGDKPHPLAVALASRWGAVSCGLGDRPECRNCFFTYSLSHFYRANSSLAYSFILQYGPSIASVCPRAALTRPKSIYGRCCHQSAPPRSGPPVLKLLIRPPSQHQQALPPLNPLHPFRAPPAHHCLSPCCFRALQSCRSRASSF